MAPERIELQLKMAQTHPNTVSNCSILTIVKTLSLYRIEGNFGGGKHWRIWRMTINSPKFNPPIFILD